MRNQLLGQVLQTLLPCLLLRGLPSDVIGQLLQLLELALPSPQLLAQLRTLRLLGQLRSNLRALLLQLLQLRLPFTGQMLAQLAGLPQLLTQVLAGLLLGGNGLRQVLFNLSLRRLRLLPSGMLRLQLARRFTGRQPGQLWLCVG